MVCNPESFLESEVEFLTWTPHHCLWQCSKNVQPFRSKNGPLLWVWYDGANCFYCFHSLFPWPRITDLQCSAPPTITPWLFSGYMVATTCSYSIFQFTNDFMNVYTTEVVAVAVQNPSPLKCTANAVAMGLLSADAFNQLPITQAPRPKLDHWNMEISSLQPSSAVEFFIRLNPTPRMIAYFVDWIWLDLIGFFSCKQNRGFMGLVLPLSHGTSTGMHRCQGEQLIDGMGWHHPLIHLFWCWHDRFWRLNYHSWQKWKWSAGSAMKRPWFLLWSTLFHG